MKRSRLLSVGVLVLGFGLCLHANAARSLAVGAAGSLLKTMAGQRYLSQMTGKSLGEVGQMGLSARINALTEATKGDEKLIFQLTRASEQISASRDPEALAGTLLAALKPSPSQGILKGRSSSRGKEALGKMRREGMTAKLEKAFQGRSDVDQKAADAIVKAGVNVKSQVGADLYGSDALRCVSTFESGLVSNLGGIVRGMVGSRNGIKTVDDVFESLVQGSRRTFEVTRAQAKERVCGLAGHGSECGVFSKATFKTQCVL
ncbi:MAG: hypothetical protein OXB88_02505 [Bacteriovoracales bacterium]|nr:hypothetical protein [Bacteriovoracales bacterium]